MSTPTTKTLRGRIKRQVARFRVYGLNAAGGIVKELTAHDAHITWTVHIANKKASWYQFRLALDIPEAASLAPDMQSMRRNASHRGHDRHRLVIDPGPRSITGINAHGPAHRFDSGTFLGKRVTLGEVRTDARGRLLVFGGFGNSGTTQAHNAPTHIANNDGWHDDTGDGPVTASVVLHGKQLPVTPAWVIVGPPSYGPGITSIVTLYDVAYQAYLDGHPGTNRPVSFTRHIYPILERFDRMQWVNEGFFQGYGWQGEVALLAPDLLAQLSSNSPLAAPVRGAIFDRFRDPSYPAVQEDAWPRLYGDNFAQPPRSARQYLAVTREQYRRLREWAVGNFTADRDPTASAPGALKELPVQARPGALDRAALESCSGGPFHPGEEAPWIMRQPSLYSGLCRLRVRGASDPHEPNYGHVLTPARALGRDGPLHRSGPGDITRWMAVPWQTDSANCGSAYPQSTVQPPKLPDLPTFWPAIVPNTILTELAYQRILDTELPAADRQASFHGREAWNRHLPSQYQVRNNRMVTDWYRLGFVTPHSGPSDPAFPTQIYVETESGFSETTEPGSVPAGEDGGPHQRKASSPNTLDDRRSQL
jgi:L-Lysine epsilon oxidase N-terminal/L-lysine epsilon oxidase C-terminal domain